MQAKISYLKDKDEEVISPVTSIESVFDEQGRKLSNYLLETLFPVNSTITTLSNINPGSSLGGEWSQSSEISLVGSLETTYHTWVRTS